MNSAVIVTSEFGTCRLASRIVMDLPAEGLHFGPTVSCVCHAQIPIPDDVVRRYLDGEQAICPACEVSQDWWGALLDSVKSVMTVPLAVIGAHQTIFRFELRRDEVMQVDITALGVPDDATIVRTYYTTMMREEGDSPLWPGQILTSQPALPVVPRQFSVFPVGWDAKATESEVSVLVSWLPAEEPDVARSQLVEAFDAYTRGNHFDPPDLGPCIIPANTAVEVALGGLLTARLSADVGTTRARAFLDDAATYGHQLNVLLPLLAKGAGGPELPDHVRGALNRLRSLRNQLAHGGAPDEPITKDEAATCLCAAFVGLGYVRLVEPIVHPAA